MPTEIVEEIPCVDAPSTEGADFPNVNSQPSDVPAVVWLLKDIFPWWFRQ